MDRFVVKWPNPVTSTAASTVARKKAKQLSRGTLQLTAKQRVKHFSSGVFYEDDNKMFCRNHTATFAKMTVAIPQLLVKKIATKVRP